MYVFVDESGDAGFKVDQGSSEHFVVACVLVQTKEDCQSICEGMARIRTLLGRCKESEFRFSESSRKVREVFFPEVKNYPFSYRAIIMPKDRIYGRELLGSIKSFHKYTIKHALMYNEGDIHDATVFVDRIGDRNFKESAESYFMREVNKANHERVINDVKFRDSKSNDLLQLADMVAGAVRRSCHKRQGSTVYRDIIKSREKRVWIFGQQPKK